MSVKPFEKLTPAGKRCRIARDVLAQLDAKKLVARHNTYLEAFTPDRFHSFEETSVADVMKMPVTESFCEVCAMGALLACKVKYENGIFVETAGSRFAALESLSSYFSRLQIAMIEAAFEGCGHDLAAAYEAARDGDRDAVAKYRAAEDHFLCLRYDEKGNLLLDADKRLRDVMHNIIANKGEFVPTGKLTPAPVKSANQYTKVA